MLYVIFFLVFFFVICLIAFFYIFFSVTSSVIGCDITFHIFSIVIFIFSYIVLSCYILISFIRSYFPILISMSHLFSCTLN